MKRFIFSVFFLFLSGMLHAQATLNGQPAVVSGTLTPSSVASTGTITSLANYPYGIEANGDSTCVGQYSGNTSTLGGLGMLYWMNKYAPGGVISYYTTPTDPRSYYLGAGYCQDGGYVTDAAQLVVFAEGPYRFGQAPPMVLHDGLNDSGNYTSTYQQNMDVAADLAVETWRLTPFEQMIVPPSGAIVHGGSGTATLNATRISTLTPTIEDNTNGDTFTFSITTTITQPSFVIWFEALDANSGGATVSIDGTATGTTLASGNSCPGLTGPSTSGLCIYTAGWHTYATPQAKIFTPSAAGTHTVLLTVAGASGSGMGFSLIGAAPLGPYSNTAVPYAAAQPVVYRGGIPDFYGQGSNHNVYDSAYMVNVETLQALNLPILRVCGLTANDSTFVGSTTTIQPQGCSDVPTPLLDTTIMGTTTTAYNSTTGQLTAVLTAAVPATVQVGDQEIITGAVNEPTINTTTFWTVVSKSGSTLVLQNPAFTGATWSATSDAAVISKDFYAPPHMNSHGYYKEFLAYDHYMKLPGGGNGSANYVAPTNLNLSRIKVTANYQMTGAEGIIDAFCTTGNNFTITLPSQPASNNLPLNTPAGNGPIIINNIGTASSNCGVTISGSTSAPANLGVGSSIIVTASSTPNAWNLVGTNNATSLTALNCGSYIISANYTVVGDEPCIRMGASTVLTLTLPANPLTTSGFIWVVNSGTQNISVVAGSGASVGFAAIPSGQSALLFVYGGTHWFNIGGTVPNASVEYVTFSATPTFNSFVTTSYLGQLTANVTSFTLGAGPDGFLKTLCFQQNSPSYTVTPPSNVHGFFSGNSGEIGTTNLLWNCQSYTYNANKSLWFANSQGVINQ